MVDARNPPQDPRAEFINASVWHGSLTRAQQILAAHPDVASSDIYTAALLGDHEAVARFLAEDPSNATAKGGPRNWDISASPGICGSNLLVPRAFSRPPAAVCLGRRDDIARLAKQASPEEKQKALAAAAYVGRLAAIETAISLGADPNAPNVGLNPDATALHNAVCSGSLAAVQKLVEAGASADAKDGPHKATPLQWAEYFVRESGAGTREYLQGAGIRPRQYVEIASYLRLQQRP